MKLQRKPESKSSVLREMREAYHFIGERTPLPFASARRIKRAYDKAMNGILPAGRIERQVRLDYIAVMAEYFDDGPYYGLDEQVKTIIDNGSTHYNIDA